MVGKDGGLERVLGSEEASRQIYSREHVLGKCREYFGTAPEDDLAVTTWMNKYADKRDPDEFYEATPRQMHRRMAREFARKEGEYGPVGEDKRGLLSEYGQTRQTLTEERIFELFDNFNYTIPQGSVMASLGVPGNLSSLSNCVVLPELYDSIGGIMEADQQLAQLYKRRCGVGLDMSPLRPNNHEVANDSKSTSGAVSFAQRFSNTTGEIAQKGRRGALMLTMDIAHPDVRDFVEMKQDRTKVTRANVSVRLSDEFMRAVEEKGVYTHKWPIGSDKPSVTKDSDAEELWNRIIECAHNTAEPGLIFWDKQHKYSPSSVYPKHRNISTNPCAEIAMGPDSCRLMAMNLYGFVENPFTSDARFNFEKFKEYTYESMRLMDDLVDLELEHIERIVDKVRNDPEPDYVKEPELRVWQKLYDIGKSARRTGLGFTGLGDTFAALGYSFDSDEAAGEFEKIMRTKCEAEFDSSIDMAIERGRFDDFDPEIEKTSEFIQMMEREFPQVYERMMTHGRRNISLSTVAPTGSLSILAQTSGGIEPVFKLKYDRRRKVNPDDPHAKVVFVDDVGDSWEEFPVFHPKVEEWMRITGKKNISESPYAGSASDEIDWIKRVDIQAIAQKYTTHSISSTVNLPKDVEPVVVGEIYMESWRRGLKGITVYRDTSRDGVLITGEGGLVELVQESVADLPIASTKPDAEKYRVRRRDAGDSLHVILTSDLYVDDESKKAYFIPDEDFQVRAPLGASTSVTFAQSGMDRTEILRGPNPDYAEFISRLLSVSSSEDEGMGPNRIKSIEHAVGVVFEHYLTKNGVVERDSKTNQLVNKVRKGGLRMVESGSEEYKSILVQRGRKNGKEEKKVSGSDGRMRLNCPKCDAKLVHEEGCVKCVACGDFNKCG